MISKVVLAGYYGFGNLGDELILKVILSELSKSSKKYAVTVLYDRAHKNFPEFPAAVADRWSISQVFKALVQCDALVFGGGGVLQDQTGFLSFWYYLSLIWLAIVLGKKVIFLAQGFGPVRNALNRLIFRFTLRFVDWISVRDRESFLALPRGQKNAFLSADPVLLLDFPVSRGSHGAKLIFVPCDVKEFDWEAAAQALLTWSEDAGTDVVLLPFQESRDLALTERLKKRLGARGRIAGWKSLDDAVHTLSKGEMVVSMRLHALILSALLNKPFLGISANPKMDSFLKEFDLAPAIQPLSVQQIRKCWEDKERLRQVVQEKMPDLKRRAKISFDSLEI